MTTTRRAGAATGARRRSPIATAMWWASALLLGVAVLGVVALTVGTATGWLSIQTVPTGSMEPAIHEGSAIVVDPIPVDDIAVGDVIVFAAPETDRMTVHRVVEVQTENGRRVFLTKGDANEAPDPWRLLPDEDHLHRVRYAVPGVGRVLLVLSAPWARMALAGLGGALVLWFGLTHVWRRADADGDEGPSHAHETWHRALERLTEPLHHHHDHSRPTTEGRSAEGPFTVDAAVDAAEDRRLDGLEALLLAADPSPRARRTSTDTGSAADTDADADTGGGGRRGRTVGGTAVVVVVALVVAGAAIVVPSRVAEAAFNATTAAAGAAETLTVPAKADVACSWDTATSTTVSWTNPNTTDTAQLLVATSSGGSTTVAATAAAGATSATYAPSAPLTTTRYLSTVAVDGTWTSDATPEMATNRCRRAVNLFAGAGSNGSAGDGGAATAARLSAPLDTAEGPDGRVFIADSGNDVIRVVSTAGVITTFAGEGTATACGYSGSVSGLQLNAPRGVAVDDAGNVYIADTGANCIRKVDAAGNVSRVAGGGGTTTCGTTTATAVSLSNPSGLEVDAAGNVYVADTNRNCIRKVDAAGNVTRVAGGGGTTTCGTTTATAVSLSGPLDIDLDASGAVYVADTGRGCIRKVVGTAVTAVAGGGGTTACTATVAGTSLSLSSPQSVAVDTAGTVYLSDTGRRCVRQVVAGTASPLAFTGGNSSSGDGGPSLGATARTPSFLTVLADGDLLISDRATNSGSNDVRRVELG